MSPDELSIVAVAIPCYNEATAIASVVQEWRVALPMAEIVVFDNNSSDGTGAIAHNLGVRVVPVMERGKGNVVREIFRVLPSSRAVILVDGDGTYPASEAHGLLAMVLDGTADMVIGARQPVAVAGAMTPVRGLGNILIRLAFRLFIGRGPGDLLSGYRVFSPRFLREIQLTSSGFEIETEIAAKAVFQRMKTAELDVPYYPRIEGSTSKLRAFRDGRRILWTILQLSSHWRPQRLVAVVASGVVAVIVIVYLITAVIR